MKDLTYSTDGFKFNYRVGVMIEIGEKVLCEVCPENDYLVFPGGKVKALEYTFDALKRELFEELNYEIDKSKLKLRAVYENLFSGKGKDWHELFFLYRIVLDESVSINRDNLVNQDSKLGNYYKWVTKEEMKNVKILPDTLKDLAFTSGFNHEIINDLQKDA